MPRLDVRRQSRLQPVPIVRAEVEESLLQQLCEDSQTLVVGQAEESPRLCDGRRQPAHVAEFATHTLHEFLIGGVVGRRGGGRRDSKRAEGGGGGSVRGREWLLRGGRAGA